MTEHTWLFTVTFVAQYIFKNVQVLFVPHIMVPHIK